MFELGQRYKIFFRSGVEAPIEGYNGSDPSKYYAIGTFAGMYNSNNSTRTRILIFRDLDRLTPYTHTYYHLDRSGFQESQLSESSPTTMYHAVKVNPESGLPMSGGGRRRRSTRRQKRNRSKRGSRKH